jgi:transcriptional regulator with XRE-family HTH domain
VKRRREGDIALTPNQVVAYNLPRARLFKGWTQEEAAEALAPFLGTKWSVANFSAIERSVDGGRIRQFTADDLLALSRAFELPIGFFLTPPGDDPRGVRIATPDTRKQGGADAMVLLDAVLGTDESLEVWEQVLATIGWAAGSRAQLVDGKWVNKGRVVADQLPRARRLAALRTRTLLSREFGDTETARSVLTRLIGLLEVLEGEDEPEAGGATRPKPTKGARSKPAK